MEGLLPMMYKAIKKKRNRSGYEYLSSGATAAGKGFNEEYWPLYAATNTVASPKSLTDVVPGQHQHRRHRSMGDYAFGTHGRDFMGDHDHDMITDDKMKKKKEGQLVRFRSQRSSFRNRMFSCVGVAC